MSNLLEVGDTILKRHFGSISLVGKIDRVTNTTAFIDNSKYKRELGHKSKTVTSIPRSKYSSAWLFVADENDLAELRKQSLIYFVVNFDYSKLSYDKICDICDVIKRAE